MKTYFANHEMFNVENYGDLLNCSSYKNLIDKEAEYYTRVRKHMFEGSIVLEFTVKNNDEEHD